VNRKTIYVHQSSVRKFSKVVRQLKIRHLPFTQIGEWRQVDLEDSSKLSLLFLMTDARLVASLP
jgi:hypothetical protein